MRVRIEERDHRGAYIWHYDGALVRRDAAVVVVETRVMRDVQLPSISFTIADRMTEMFYPARWYNIKQIHDARTGRLKGWYCPITRPPSVKESADGRLTIAYDSLALEACISPVGELLVLDEDELATLKLPTFDWSRAWFGLGHLRGILDNRLPPFDILQG